MSGKTSIHEASRGHVLSTEKFKMSGIFVVQERVHHVEKKVSRK